MTIGPKLAYCPKANSMNISGKPAKHIIAMNGIKKAPEKKRRTLLKGFTTKTRK